LRTHAKLGTGK
jgi:hypothetical protein